MRLYTIRCSLVAVAHAVVATIIYILYMRSLTAHLVGSFGHATTLVEGSQPLEFTLHILLAPLLTLGLFKLVLDMPMLWAITFLINSVIWGLVLGSLIHIFLKSALRS